MESFFFTCGQSHAHQIGGGRVWDKDSVLEVYAENENAAREKVFELFGPKWSHCYTKETIGMAYYPKGVCGVIYA